MSRPTLKEQQRKLREDIILDEAYELLARKGYEAMSVDEVAAQVGISKATLYHHFSSKEELAINIVVRLMQRGEERMHAIDEQLPAIRRLEEMLRSGLARRAQLWGTDTSLLPLGLRAHPAYLAQRARMLGHVAALIEKAKLEGDIDAEMITVVVARTLAQLYQIDYSDLAADDAACQAVTNTLTRLVFDGLCSRRPD